MRIPEQVTPGTEEISSEELTFGKRSLWPLVGLRIPYLSVPLEALIQFEPSQIGTLVGTIVDASLPYLAESAGVGLLKHPGILLDREGYPDFVHSSGKRIELKGLFLDNYELPLKKPNTPREPSARITQKVTVKNVDPTNDILLILAYRLEQDSNGNCSPTIVDLEIFPMLECVLARDHRLIEAGGRWFGNYETPAILSKVGIAKKQRGEKLNEVTYGRKESEGHDYNEDTNFGKLKRIPYAPLQQFLRKCGVQHMTSGTYPMPWRLR